LASNPINQGSVGFFLDSVASLVTSVQFDFFFSACIVLNVVLMALQAQLSGFDSGQKVQYVGYSRGAGDVWPWGPPLLQGAEMFFGVLYTCELVVKCIGLGRDFLKDHWNWIDCAIVACWSLDVSGSLILPINPIFLRLARLMKLLRVLKLVKFFEGFDSLYLMTKAIKTSFPILVWATVILVLIQTLFALILRAVLEKYILDDSKPLEGRQAVFKLYGSFSRAFLTMFEITFANWTPACRILMEHVSEFYIMFSLVHKLSVGFSIVSVLIGVFIQETFKVATSDDHIMLINKDRSVLRHARQMDKLFHGLDLSNDGVLTREEFANIVHSPSVKHWLSALELDVVDAHLLFDLVDDGDEEVTATELREGIARLKGTARSIDVNATLYESKSAHQRCQEILEEQRHQRAVMDEIEKALGQLTSQLANPERA